ncbi:MAG: AraC family transcriptional regulator ligand-binding domain-containing protein [Thiogranum sp.]
MTIYAPLVGIMWRVLEANGYDPHSLISREVYDPENESVYNDRVSRDVHVAIEKKTYELIDDPTLGLQMATHIHPSHLGALGHAWLASSSLRTALLRTQRFNRMLDEQAASQIEETETQIRVVHQLHRNHPCPEMAADGQLSCLLALCRLNFGEELLPKEVTMRRPEPEGAQQWHDHFGIHVRFDQPTDSIAFSASDADRKLTSSNRELVEAHEDLVQRHLAYMDRKHIESRVQLAMLEELPSGGITEERMAELLNMSTRTLHRKLGEDGTTFSSLLLELRRELADRYLRDSKYSITEIAFMLGYAETSAFSRAFRNWFDESPTQFREKHSR